MDLTLRHTKRIIDLIQGEEVWYGGDYDIADKYIAPTILVDVDPESSACMQDEIFGSAQQAKRIIC